MPPHPPSTGEGCMTPTENTPPPAGRPADSPLERWFRIGERGSTPGREVRGGLATFFTMAYIVVLNPIIIANVPDKFHHTLSGGQVAAMTALVAAVMTIIMGVGGNLPLAIATGLGL